MKTFVVLGMHRSATSLVAHGLYKSDVFMGEKLLGAHESNVYGHWEDIEFIRLNDQLLKAAGGSWDKPPLKQMIKRVGEIHSNLIMTFVQRKQKAAEDHGYAFWGWKDPRTSLTIECFLPHLVNPHFFVCYRDPVEVAKSLNKRDGMPLKDGIALAMIYNNRITEFITKWYSSNADAASALEGIQMPA